MNKTMIIGLGPEYNYPEDYDLWLKYNTKYASNHGASLISRALAKQFNGEYVDPDEFSKVEELREKYDQCIIAFATHITNWRDVSLYTNFVEKLGLPTYAFSLGVQDYASTASSVLSLHPSMKRLLEIVSDRSRFLGVRGNYTASILYKNGFKNVVPLGCPTVYWNLNRDLTIHKPAQIENPAVVYHRTLAGKEGIHILKDIPIIGQDFLDEVVFTNNLDKDTKLKNDELQSYELQGFKEEALALIRENGVFHATFQDWFNYLKTRDFILGARLHGCIGALIQGVPAVLIARDLRVMEISEFFNLPYVSYNKLNTKKSALQVFEEADYTKFNQTYKVRYDNYVRFLHENGLQSQLNTDILNDDFMFTHQDLIANLGIFSKDIQQIREELQTYGSAIRTAELLRKLVNKIPLLGKLASGLK